MSHLFVLLLSFYSQGAELQLEKIRLPEGFQISIYAKGLTDARSMAWGKDGVLFVGTKDEGKVYAVEKNGTVHTIAKDLNRPNGVAFKDNDLFVAENHRVIKYQNILSDLNKPPTPQVIANYPKDKHHGWKYISFGPDGRLYVSQGVPCNICEVKIPYGTITSILTDGTKLKVVAHGIRNSVGFDWHPLLKELWFTDNGRDHLGDNKPGDELNRVVKDDPDFGFPYCHGMDVLDPEFGKGKKCASYQTPEKVLGPHVAALGMRFYTGTTFPQKYQKQIFIAEHGSWNRSEPLGYRIMLVTLDERVHAKDYEIFAQGWLQGSKAWGRPVDIINAPDGSILVSDDLAGAIYKIQYQKK